MSIIKINTNIIIETYNQILFPLPDYVPDEAIKHCLSSEPCFNCVKGLNYYIDSDPGRCPPQLAYVATDEEDLKRRIFEDVSYDIARYIQTLNIENEKSHNERFNFEKSVREYHLNLLKSQLSQGELNLIIKRHENSINPYYGIKHWEFDKDKFVFVEISD